MKFLLIIESLKGFITSMTVIIRMSLNFCFLQAVQNIQYHQWSY